MGMDRWMDGVGVKKSKFSILYVIWWLLCYGSLKKYKKSLKKKVIVKFIIYLQKGYLKFYWRKVFYKGFILFLRFNLILFSFFFYLPFIVWEGCNQLV